MDFKFVLDPIKKPDFVYHNKQCKHIRVCCSKANLLISYWRQWFIYSQRYIFSFVYNWNMCPFNPTLYIRIGYKIRQLFTAQKIFDPLFIQRPAALLHKYIHSITTATSGPGFVCLPYTNNPNVRIFGLAGRIDPISVCPAGVRPGHTRHG